MSIQQNCLPSTMQFWWTYHNKIVHLQKSTGQVFTTYFHFHEILFIGWLSPNMLPQCYGDAYF